MTGPNEIHYGFTATGTGEVRDADGNLLNQEPDDAEDDDQ